MLEEEVAKKLKDVTVREWFSLIEMGSALYMGLSFLV